MEQNNAIYLVLAAYIAVINLCAFLIMFADKQFAKRGSRRVPEATLMLISALGGSVGCLIAMYTFRHKTRHIKFTAGVPAILIIQLLLVAFLVLKFYFKII